MACCARAFVGWAKRSVPTILARCALWWAQRKCAFAHPYCAKPSPDRNSRAISWMPARAAADFVARGGGSGSLSAPIRRNAASAARSPLSQAPSTVPHSVSWVASPARYMQPIGSVKIFRDDCPPGLAADIAPSANGAAFQRVALDFFTAAATSLPNSFVSHSIANATIACSPCAERSRPNEPRDIDRAQRRTADIGVTSAPSASNCSAR